MKPQVRAAVAAVAVAHATGNRLSSIYDYDKGAHWSMSVSVNGAVITAYDYESSAHFSGTLPNLYHYGESCHVSLTPGSNGKYSGYDYGESCHFTVTVKGKIAQIYDYGSSEYFSYAA